MITIEARRIMASVAPCPITCPGRPACASRYVEHFSPSNRWAQKEMVVDIG